MTLIYAVIMFVILIFPHELGHFAVAKAVGVKVNEFAFGMGPVLLKKQGKETLYSIRLVPIGGFCAMEGENEESENERAFNNKPGWAKISVLLAGSLMNILIAILVMSILVGSRGIPTLTLGNIQDNSPAYQAGLQKGDEITRINDKALDEWDDLIQSVGKEKDSVSLTFLRNGQEHSLEITPEKNQEGRYVIGVKPQLSHSPLLAVKHGCISSWNMVKTMYQGLAQLVTGKISADNISGPVGMVSLVSDTSKYGIGYFAYLLALISLNLAIINLLPLPALDGGRILFVIIRKITGRMISDDLEGKIHGIGIILLFALMIFATWNDIERLFL